MTLTDIERLEVVQLQPGDVLVLTLPEHTSLEDCERLRQLVADKFADPNVQVLVKTHDVGLDVVRSADTADQPIRDNRQRDRYSARQRVRTIAEQRKQAMSIWSSFGGVEPLRESTSGTDISNDSYLDLADTGLLGPRGGHLRVLIDEGGPSSDYRAGVLDRGQATQLRDQLTAWLERTKP